MNQGKIGKFIASCRKKQKLTQEQLAEKLGITYKAVSKWETGKGLPDASIMKDLCCILKITVNELLSGEKISSDLFVDKADENLIKVQREKEYAIASARWSYVITIIILLILNFINVFKYGVQEAISKSEFGIMITISLIYFAIYLFQIKRTSKR